MLFNEPKLLKWVPAHDYVCYYLDVSVLFNEPKLLKLPASAQRQYQIASVSVLFNEPKLLKWNGWMDSLLYPARFSALQRAEIAEIDYAAAGR